MLVSTGNVIPIYNVRANEGSASTQPLPEPLQHAVDDALDRVCDPELPGVTIRDLGVLRQSGLCDDGSIEVVITPTYSGCPAVVAIREAIIVELAAAGFDQVIVTEALSPPWSSDDISESGHEALRELGIAPPRGATCADPVPASGLECPQCGSTETRLLTEFGSTACKAMYRCAGCSETFDYFKGF